MITNPTNEHREQARERLPRWSDCEAAVDDERATPLERFIYEYEPADASLWRERLRAVVLSRDAEIREVLEGLASKVYASFKGEYCWCRRAGLATQPEGDSHDLHCQRTRKIYAKLQPGKEREDVER